MKKVVFRLQDNVDFDTLACIIKLGLPKKDLIIYEDKKNDIRYGAIKINKNKTETYEIWKGEKL